MRNPELPADQRSGDAIHLYIRELQRSLDTGSARERTHRPALKALVEALDTRVTANNDPQHLDCGAPDFTVYSGTLTLG